MGHSSIRVTVDIYGPLIPGANVSFVDRLDHVPEEPPKTTPPQPRRNYQRIANVKFRPNLLI
jgi:integrase